MFFTYFKHVDKDTNKYNVLIIHKQQNFSDRCKIKIIHSF